MHDIWEIRRTKELLLKLFGGTATTLKTVKKEHFYMFFYFDEKESNMEAKGFSGNEIQEDKTIVGSDEVIVNVAEAEEKSTDLREEDADKETKEMQEKKKKKKTGSDVSANNITMPNLTSVKQMAKEKLEKEIKADEDKTFAEFILGYLLKRCEDNLGLAEDVVQKHKTWKKCLDYIYEQARKQATGNMAAVHDDVVCEWAEDYYHKDDKAEEEKKAKEAAERKKKQEERAKKAKTEPQKAEIPKPKEKSKSKKKNKDMDGQLDMFSMMGM